MKDKYMAKMIINNEYITGGKLYKIGSATFIEISDGNLQQVYKSTAGIYSGEKDINGAKKYKPFNTDDVKPCRCCGIIKAV